MSLFAVSKPCFFKDSGFFVLGSLAGEGSGEGEGEGELESQEGKKRERDKDRHQEALSCSPENLAQGKARPL